MKIPFVDAWVFFFLVGTRNPALAERWELMKQQKAHLRRNPKKREGLKSGAALAGEVTERRDDGSVSGD